MAVVAFWNNTKEQCGVTSSSMAFATQMAIKHNMKVLLLSTSLNDKIIRESFWDEKKQKRSGLFLQNTNTNGNVEKNGIEGLDRVLRSNKITPEIISDYTRVILTGRFEILLGFEGKKEAYDELKQRYSQIISLAKQYYNIVVVDIDKSLGDQTIKEVLKVSDVVVCLTSQRANDIENVVNTIKSEAIVNPKNSIITIGKYNSSTKYNAKNISRNILKQKDTVNTIPFNNLFFEASQEGKVLDALLMLMNIKEKDENYEFIQEINRLIENVQTRIKMLQMKI